MLYMGIIQRRAGWGPVRLSWQSCFSNWSSVLEKAAHTRVLVTEEYLVIIYLRICTF